MNRFLKVSICALSLSSLVVGSASAQSSEEQYKVGQLNEYGSTLTGAVEEISGDIMKNYNLTSTQALVGQFAALNGTSIRGTRTSGTATALILVDGFEQDLTNVDVEDIESIKLLKDAAAVAAYGVDAANGIILITTKRGELNMKPKVTVKATQGWLYTASTPDMVSGETYDSVIESLTGYTTNSTANIDWVDEMLRPLVNETKASAQIVGGTKLAKYFLSASYNYRGSYYNHDDNAYSEFSSEKNTSLRSNVEVNVSRNTTFTAMMSLYFATTKTPQNSSLVDYCYTTPSTRYNLYTDYTDSEGNVTQYFDETLEFQLNPYARFVGKGYTHTHSRNVSAQAVVLHELDYLTKGLFVKGRVSMFTESAYANSFTASYLSAGAMPDGSISTFGTYSPLAYDSTSNSQDTWQTFSLAAGYDRKFEKHSVAAVVTARLDNYYTNAVAGNIFNLATQAQYAYDNRYVAEFTMTYGGTNSNNPVDHFVLLPTLGLAWNVSNESFFNSGDVVNSLKVRGSIGQLGYDQYYRFTYLDNYSSGTSHRFGVNAGTSYTTYVESIPYDVTYEKSLAANIGVDLRLFNGLNLSVDYFNEERYDIIESYETQISGTWGGTVIYMNNGKVHSQGVEIVANYVKSFSDDLSLSTTFTAGFSKNIITETFQYDNPYVDIIGDQQGQTYGWVADGIYQLTDFDSAGNLNDGLAVNSYGAVQAGDIKYADLSGADGVPDGIIDAYDKVALGANSNPVMLGLNLNLNYKRFFAGVHFDAQTNRTSNLVANYIFTPLDDGYDNISTYAYENAWSVDNQSGTLPRLSVDEVAVNNLNSTLYMYNSNYLRLRTAQIGYNIPLKNSEGVFDKNLALSISGHNLFVWDSLPSNIDATRTGYAICGSSFQFNAEFTF